MDSEENKVIVFYPTHPIRSKKREKKGTDIEEK